MNEPTNAREVLDIIDEFLAKNCNNHEAVKLWDTLTALRGPDDVEDWGVKDRTTTVIRRAALPKVAHRAAHRAGKDEYFSIPAAFYTEYSTIQKPPAVAFHFWDHIQRAAYALDLEVTPYRCRVGIS